MSRIDKYKNSEQNVIIQRYLALVVVRIASVQLRSMNTRAESIEHVIKMLRKAGAVEPDIVSLPELWYPKIVHSFEQEFKSIIDVAREQNMIIISGAFLERINDNLYISSPVISTDGIILGRQFKIHPFGNQRKVVKSGTTTEIFEGGQLQVRDSDMLRCCLSGSIQGTRTKGCRDTLLSIKDKQKRNTALAYVCAGEGIGE